MASESLQMMENTTDSVALSLCVCVCVFVFVQALFQESTEDVERQRALQKRKVASVSPAIDLTADLHDGFSEGYGLRHNGARVIGDTSHLETSTLVKDLNRHAAVVVSNLPEAQQREERASSGKAGSSRCGADVRPRAEAQMLEDLVKPSQEGFEALHVRMQGNGKREGVGVGIGGGGGGGGGSDRAAASALVRELASGGARSPLTEPEEERKILVELAKRNRLVQNRNKMLKSATSGGQSVEAATVAQLRGMAQAVNELLRHFWASFPLSSPQREAKVGRLNKALADLYEQISQARSAMDPAARQLAKPLIAPILQACDAAFTKADRAAAEKAAKG